MDKNHKYFIFGFVIIVAIVALFFGSIAIKNRNLVGGAVSVKQTKTEYETDQPAGGGDDDGTCDGSWWPPWDMTKCCCCVDIYMDCDPTDPCGGTNCGDGVCVEIGITEQCSDLEWDPDDENWKLPGGHSVNWNSPWPD